MFVNTHTQKYYRLVHWPLPRFLLLTLETRTYVGLSPVTTDDASCFNALGLVSTQAPLISCSTRSSKLPFIQKAVAVVAIVWGMVGRAYVRDEINIRANAPSPLLPQTSMQKGERIFGSLRYIQIIVADCPIVMNPTTTSKIMRSTPNLVLFQCRSLSIVCVQLEQLLCPIYKIWRCPHLREWEYIRAMKIYPDHTFCLIFPQYSI